MEKITEALEEPHTRSNVRQITEEAERSGSCFLSLGLESRCRVLLLSGEPGAASQHPLRVALSHLQLQLQGI